MVHCENFTMFATGGSIDIPDTTSREGAVQHAIAKIKALGRDGYEKALARTPR